jgi:hypothetical protein
MTIPGHRYIEALIEKKSAYCISIYLPVHRVGDAQDSLRYKNLVAEAEKMLIKKGARPPDAAEYLAPEYELAMETAFWKNLGDDGLAVFIGDGRRDRLPSPRSFNESVTVARRFKVKPLIPLLTGDGRFFILALDQDRTRLFMASHFKLTEIALPEGAPVSLADTLKDDEPRSQLQYHPGTAGTGGRREAMYLGQGAAIDEDPQSVSRFFQQLNKYLYPVFYDENIPVVLAGVESLLPLYRKSDTSRLLMEKSVTTNPEAMRPEELHAQCWEVVAPRFVEREKAARAKFQELHGTGRAITDLTEIVAAGDDGRIETLFTAEDAEEWGLYDPAGRRVELTDQNIPEAVDLFDLAVARTLSTRGTVFVRKQAEMPVDQKIAAILRY